jgi:hypothetical protein
MKSLTIIGEVVLGIMGYEIKIVLTRQRKTALKANASESGLMIFCEH